jgi:RNA polymerase sigma-70 factor (ECF subfamily)
MTSADPRTFTRLLRGARGGDASAGESLVPLIYAELGSLAAQLFAREPRRHTLQPTALVHEAWVKLVGHLGRIEDRGHFFALASQAMRQVLADHARRAATVKRGGRRPVVTLDGSLAAGAGAVDVVDLDDSLTRLAALNPRHARVVELRVLGGLTIAETAAALEVSDKTVERDWFMARAWLRTELGPTG